LLISVSKEMDTMQKILDKTYYDNTVQAWLIALGITLVVWLALFVVRKVAVGAIKHLTQKTALAWDDVLAAIIPRTHGLFLLALSILAGSTWLELAENQDQWIRKLVVVVGLVQLGLWATCAVTFFVQSHRERKLKEDPASVTTIGALALLARIVVWILVLLLILTNAGVEIGPLLAGLGVGGIAIALAVQAVLKDLLASLSIILDKPFVVGDFLILGDLMGAVEHIGLKTTRIRSLSGEQLVFSNNDLLESRIRNFGRMKERRAVFNIGVTYQTPHEKIQRIPDILKAAVEAQEKTRFDRSHFKTYGDFSLGFETVYYVAVPDMTKYLDIQQAINLRIYREFEKQDIQFAYPTQTLFLNQEKQKSAVS